jgi:hypothetical protein
MAYLQTMHWAKPKTQVMLEGAVDAGSACSAGASDPEMGPNPDFVKCESRRTMAWEPEGRRVYKQFRDYKI